MIPLNTQALYDFLVKKGVQVEMQKETGQIFFGFRSQEENFAIFMRVYDQSQLLQIIVFLPLQYQEKGVGDVARLLHWINQAVDLPGFGMEETGKTIFYRLMLPALGMELDDRLIEPFLGAVRGVCETFFQSIKKVAVEGVSFEALQANRGDAS